MKKILILTASYGSGHVIAAKALDEEFRKKGIEPVVLDLVLQGGVTERGAASFYEFLMRRGHFAWKIFHDNIMPIRKGDSIRGLYKLIHRKRFFKEIGKFSPDIIISTMDTASLVASLFKLSNPKVKIYTVLTDYVAHPLWVWKNMDGYFVGSEQAGFYLAGQGIDEEKIMITGIPVRVAFSNYIPKETARKKLGIPVDAKVILISAGSFRSVPVEPIIRSISGYMDSYAVILAGSKNTNIADYAGILKEYGVIGKVLDYTDVMHEFMAAADLYISKAGGLTVAECLASGLPAVYLNNFPGHEIGNAKFAAQHGAAVIAQKSTLGEILNELMADSKKLKNMSKNANEISRKNASSLIVSTIISNS